MNREGGIMEPVLHYDGRQKLFWFQDKRVGSLPGSFKVRTEQGSALAFPDAYPRNYIALQHFKQVFPNGRATSSAVERINDIKNVRSRLDSTETVSKYGRLFTRSPYAHQKTAMEYMLQYPRLMLLLEQGLGKTFISYMAIRIMKEMGIPHKTIIVCPRIVLRNWVLEVREHTDMHVIPYYGSPEQRKEQREVIRTSEWDMLVTTFDMLMSKTKEPTKQIFSSVWSKLSKERREKYAQKWLTARHVSSDEYTALLRDSGTKAYLDNAAKIIRKLPKSVLPLRELHEFEQEADSGKFFLSTGYSLLVVDEASRIIDHTSARSHAIELLSASAQRVYLLSGTICVGRPTDLYMPTRILDTSILGMNWTTFKKQFCVTSRDNEHIITGYKNLETLKLKTDPYILSMSRDECLELPERIFMQRYTVLSENSQVLYNKIVALEKVVLDGGAEISTAITIQKINKLNQVLSGFLMANDDRKALCGECKNLLACVSTGVEPGSATCIRKGEITSQRVVIPLDNPKLDLLEEDITENPADKIIIWAWYRYDIESIKQLLDKKRISYITADMKNCDTLFNADPDMQVFVGQTKQGIGITLNAATTTIYYSHGPDLEARLQSMDRNYRIGQNKKVIVKDYVCVGTIEENMLSLLQHKKSVRDFMQEKVDCLYCSDFQVCMKSGNLKMKAGCEHYTAKLAASQKVSLHIGGV